MPCLCLLLTRLSKLLRTLMLTLKPMASETSVAGRSATRVIQYSSDEQDLAVELANDRVPGTQAPDKAAVKMPATSLIVIPLAVVKRIGSPCPSHVPVNGSTPVQVQVQGNTGGGETQKQKMEGLPTHVSYLLLLYTHIIHCSSPCISARRRPTSIMHPIYAGTEHLCT